MVGRGDGDLPFLDRPSTGCLNIACIYVQIIWSLQLIFGNTGISQQRMHLCIRSVGVSESFSAMCVPLPLSWLLINPSANVERECGTILTLNKFITVTTRHDIIEEGPR